MRYFPLFINLEGKQVLVVGGRYGSRPPDLRVAAVRLRYSGELRPKPSRRSENWYWQGKFPGRPVPIMRGLPRSVSGACGDGLRGG